MFFLYLFFSSLFSCVLLFSSPFFSVFLLSSLLWSFLFFLIFFCSSVYYFVHLFSSILFLFFSSLFFSSQFFLYKIFSDPSSCWWRCWAEGSASVLPVQVAPFSMASVYISAITSMVSLRCIIALFYELLMEVSMWIETWYTWALTKIPHTWDTQSLNVFVTLRTKFLTFCLIQNHLTMAT